MKTNIQSTHAKTKQSAAYRVGILTSLTAAVAMTLATVADAIADTVTADFNNDGFQDVVFGDWRRYINGQSRAGGVSVMYTGRFGLVPGTQVQNFSQANDSNNYDDPEKNDYFGYSVAVGDFNGDGFDDLAAGAPFDTENSGRNIQGSVSIFYGSANGLTSNWPSNKFQPHRNNNTRFGYSLVAADFDQDGMDDLAVGQTGAADGPEVGAVVMYYGSDRGLRLDKIYKPGVNVPAAQSGSRFGSALAAGDINCDGYPDIAVGAPWFRNSKGQQKAGIAVIILHSANRDSFSSKTIVDVNEADNTNDQFGSSVAIGNFNIDACADVAIAHRGEKIGSKKEAGAVTVIDGDPNAWLNKRVMWYQGRANFTEKAESYDHFGGALKVGNFNGDSKDDLAIGVADEDYEATWPDRKNYGKVHVLYGNNQGLLYHNGPYDGTDYRVGTFEQGVFGLQGGRESFDRFGYALSVGDYNNDGSQDLLVGAPYERVGNDTGLIQVIHGTTRGLKPISGIHQYFHVDNLRGVGGTNQVTGLALP